MSRLIGKLVKQAGGWEKFLYSTLKDVCEVAKVSDFSDEDAETILEANEILLAYEKSIGKEQISSAPVKNVVEDVSKSKVEDKPAAKTEEKAPEKVEPEKKELPPPRAQKARLHVDDYAGACQGELPVPGGHALVNKQLMVVTTNGGIELGIGSPDGQVRGQGVSGHVSNSGNYRFVFTDVNLGTALLHYQIQQQEA
jgi:hypothetical protein